MRKLLVLSVCFILFPCHAAFGGISVGIGTGSDGISSYRVGFQKDSGVRWLESGNGSLSLLFNASADYWGKNDDDAFAASLMPILNYSFLSGRTVHPYIEAGAGVSYISEENFYGRNLGTHFQFTQIIGLGIYLGPGRTHGIRLQYVHYSNAGLDDDNDGINFYNISYHVGF